MIISGFAGIGKTHFAEGNVRAIDLESSDFQWVFPEDAPRDVEARKAITERVKNQNFIEDYVDAIIEADEMFDFVLIASQPEVLKTLGEREVEFHTASPSPYHKEDYLERYRERGNNNNFIELMEKNFVNFVHSMEDNSYSVGHIYIPKGKYLSDCLELLDDPDTVNIREELPEGIPVDNSKDK